MPRGVVWSGDINGRMSVFEYDDSSLELWVGYLGNSAYFEVLRPFLQWLCTNVLEEHRCRFELRGGV